MIKAALAKSLEFNLEYAAELIRDIPESVLFEDAGKGLENHAGFTLGHLVSALGLTIKYLGHPYELSEEWDQLFRRKGLGDPTLPSLELSKYPGSEVIMQELQIMTKKLISLIDSLQEAEFSKKVTWRFGSHFPTLLDLLLFMCIEHSSMHLGQLAAWRRAKGYGSALEKL
ncbi:MAG: DinB family protein [Bacteroidetes bacterium]|nr:MAG: DinB family protein [Bacteroidota bacterium]